MLKKPVENYATTIERIAMQKTAMQKTAMENNKHRKDQSAKINNNCLAVFCIGGYHFLWS